VITRNGTSVPSADLAYPVAKHPIGVRASRRPTHLCKLIVRSTPSKRRQPRQPGTTISCGSFLRLLSLPAPQRKAVIMPSEQGHRRESRPVETSVSDCEGDHLGSMRIGYHQPGTVFANEYFFSSLRQVSHYHTSTVALHIHRSSKRSREHLEEGFAIDYTHTHTKHKQHRLRERRINKGFLCRGRHLSYQRSKHSTNPNTRYEPHAHTKRS